MKGLVLGLGLGLGVRVRIRVYLQRNFKDKITSKLLSTIKK